MSVWPWDPSQVVEVERRVLVDGQPAKDDLGDDVEAYGDPERLDQAVFAPAMPSATTAQEPFRDGRPALLIDFPVIYLRPGQMVDALDRVLVDGKAYMVGGEPGDWRDPLMGEQYGVAVPLRKVEG